MSGAREVAAYAVDNIEELVSDMLTGDYADNEVSLGVLLCGQEEIQVQLKITRNPQDFIETDYQDWNASHKKI
ncbi:hypothetical protein [Pseudoalteromonas peptidolytica]|uniref:Uncharacterized protein n=1 Tax=Pseudoalteromonas peptidolytica F12-50-A1 TaxID=1315280 RepID=A0A8I0MYF9_9GAMM|nr:hypothetical protein [Pseudoalteromonas peptidolytica]MBE0348230.1 hypothetical protein [Pseudoalteromonas peptidolytica F12-50-A1]NLR16593.1 hypothetical protein [Pseudoalteromonas peptidolytica]GEK11885.1 hypothetical protein PPE03_41340 [Pseudoalteromonas peptidolytica]